MNRSQYYNEIPLEGNRTERRYGLDGGSGRGERGSKFGYRLRGEFGTWVSGKGVGRVANCELQVAFQR
jgi:hypothetical protein